MPKPKRLREVGRLCLLAMLAGCTSTRVTLTQRSGIEQQLLVRSLERAVSQLDTGRFTGKRVTLDLFALTEDQAFAKEFVTSRLEQRGVEVVTDPQKADLRLKIFASVLGVDRGETLLGVPAFGAPGAPIVGLPVPEIALFKWVRNRGHSEVQILAYDGRTHRLMDQTAAGVGRAKYDEYTVLLVIGFTSSDLDEETGPANR
jgi:hypothetical protein